MLKAAFYQVEQCQEPPEEIRAEMQEFAADVGLGFHAFTWILQSRGIFPSPAAYFGKWWRMRLNENLTF